MPCFNKLNPPKQLKHALEKGFSLVELIIVVAIIGIISAVAYPAYQDYTARAQLVESWNVAEIVRMTIWDYYSQHGDLPDNAPTGRQVGNPAGNTALGLPPPTALSGRYVESVTVNNAGGTTSMGGARLRCNDCTNGVLVKMRDSGVASPIAGKVMGFKMHIESTGALRWICTVKSTSGTGTGAEEQANYGTIDTRLLPGSCRTR